jgi:hypothetical protein
MTDVSEAMSEEEKIMANTKVVINLMQQNGC